MARVKRGTKRTDRRKKILARAKGYYGTHSKSHRIAKQAVDKALAYAYRDRRQKKRQLRALWIVRINAAARLHGLSYSRLIAGLKAAGSSLDRKVLADVAVRDAQAFAGLAEAAHQALAAAAPATAAPPPAAAAGGTAPPAAAQGH
jgi:large subunit ribosomal protein L20